MTARSLEREEAVAVRRAMSRTTRGRGTVLTVPRTDPSCLLTQAALEASTSGWLVVEARASSASGKALLLDLVRQTTDDRPDLLAGPGAPLVDLLAGEPRCAHDVAFALRVALDRRATLAPVLVAVHDLGAADELTLDVVDLLSGAMPDVRGLLLHEEVPAPAGRGLRSCRPALPAGPAIPGGELAAEERLASRALARARARTSAHDFALASAHRGLVRSRAGASLRALGDLDAATVHGAGAAPLPRALLLSAAVDCHLALGDLPAARRHRAALAELLAVPGEASGIAAHALAELAAADGDHAAALAGYLDAGRRLEDRPEDPAPLIDPLIDRVTDPVIDPVTWPVPWRRGAAISALHLGRLGEATRLAEADLEQARPAAPPYLLAEALRTVAAVDVGHRRTALLEEARTTLGATWAPRLAAQVDTDLAGQLILTGGDARRAADLLREALCVARLHGLAPLAHRAQRVLARLGTPPPPAPPDPTARLGVVGRRVAGLVADGLADDEIAARLFLTVGEVRREVRHARRALGVRTRARLAAAVAG